MKELESILIVDDDEALTKILSEELDFVGYRVKICNRGLEALKLIENNNFDLLLLDYKMPDITGIDVLKKARENGYKSKAIVMTGYQDIEAALESAKLDADFLSKPFDLDELLILVRKVLYSS